MHSVCVIVYVSVLIYVMYICNRLRHYMHVLVLSLSLPPVSRSCTIQKVIQIYILHDESISASVHDLIADSSCSNIGLKGISYIVV